MGTVTAIRDGLMNFVSRLGTRADKASANTYVVPFVSQEEIEAAYRTSILRKIVEIIPLDEVREWRMWQADIGTETTPIEDLENKFNIRQKIFMARALARKDGGSAIYVSVANTGAASSPLDLERVALDSLRSVTVFTKYEVTAGSRDLDIESPNYGKPESYSVPTANGTETIHHTRIIRFIGLEKQDGGSRWDGWGDPIWEPLRDPVRQMDSAAAAVAALIQEAKVDVIGIPGLTSKMSTVEYETLLTNRFTVAATLKSISNVLLYDSGNAEGKGGETYEQKELTFAGLPDIMDRLDNRVSAIADIPVTRLFGRSPAGMNATGESDMRNYYDRVKSGQEMELTPLLNPLDEIVIRSATGKRDPEIWYEWNALYTLDEKQAAEVEKQYADALAVRIQTGAIDEAVLAKAELNRMIEAGRYPGLEKAIAESDDDDGVKDPDEVEAKELERMTAEAEIAAANQNRRFAQDAAPRTLYVRRDVVNKAEITKWAREQGFTDIVPDLHVTLAHSRAPVDWFAVGQSWSDRLNIAAGGPRQMDALGDAGQFKVLLFTASEIVWRHEEMKRLGAVWAWPTFEPHISIQKGGDIDLSKVKPYQGRIVLGPEVFEEVKPD